jgi:hypothetical protein
MPSGSPGVGHGLFNETGDEDGDEESRRKSESLKLWTISKQTKQDASLIKFQGA